jgi:hypothetical protein
MDGLDHKALDPRHGLPSAWADKVHSALVALDDRGGIIQARIWAAQAALLLPSIERERLRLVEKAREFLRPPFALYDAEQIMDAGLLEIGPLAYQLKAGGAPRENLETSLLPQRGPQQIGPHGKSERTRSA